MAKLNNLPTCKHLTLCLALGLPGIAGAVDTERQFLSGKERSDAVPWEFKVTAGRRAGEQATIPVPSQWELHGFGHYSYSTGNPNGEERGLYRTTFEVKDADWKGRRVFLVFEGVMMDATVRLNGERVGPTHQGGFYQFRYDVTALLKIGAGEAGRNVLEVDVAKVSSEPGVYKAEHLADYWVFGGIFRPVYLEAVPTEAISHLAIDARADGKLTVDVEMEAARTAERVEAQLFTKDGEKVGRAFGARLPGGGTGRIRLATTVERPRLWTAETPNLYRLEVKLVKDGATVHRVETTLGFRTIEVRPGEGVYVNGERVVLRGVNRHSFRAHSGRTLDRADAYEDVRLIKEMNMNAVRMSHYPPDQVFLDVCDELGLFVLDELAGWQKGYSTEPARRLVRETVRRDVNHPSIIFWDNANEGGWNRAVDGDFALYDPQQRIVLHPWELFNDINTKHYPKYPQLQELLAQPHLVMPTEFLHGLYDGGHGAGLEDYWNAILASPRGAGGFLWSYADEGVARDDQGGRIDVAGTQGPDGIVGPNLEKEAGFYTVRDLWSPVQVLSQPSLQAGKAVSLEVANRYTFTNLKSTRWEAKALHLPTAVSRGASVQTRSSKAWSGPDVASGKTGRVDIPADLLSQEANALSVSVSDTTGAELWRWIWPLPALATEVAANANGASRADGKAPSVDVAGTELRLNAGGSVAAIDAASGALLRFQRHGKSVALSNGPRLAFSRAIKDAKVETVPLSAVQTDYAAIFDDKDETEAVWQTGTPIVGRAKEPAMANAVVVRTTGARWDQTGFRIELSSDGSTWKTLYAANRNGNDGDVYIFPPQRVQAVRISPLTHVHAPQSFKFKGVQLTWESKRYPSAGDRRAGVRVTHGADASGAWVETKAETGLLATRWTLSSGGVLRLDYRYALEGEFHYHGVTFDSVEEAFVTQRWLGQGPHRVWKNRLRGTWLDVHEHAIRPHQPGEDWNYPVAQGYFAGVYWAQLEGSGGHLRIMSSDGAPLPYLRFGTPRASQKFTDPEFPSGTLSVLHGIPAIGTKFDLADELGPQSQPERVSGERSGSVSFMIVE